MRCLWFKVQWTWMKRSSGMKRKKMLLLLTLLHDLPNCLLTPFFLLLSLICIWVCMCVNTWCYHFFIINFSKSICRASVELCAQLERKTYQLCYMWSAIHLNKRELSLNKFQCILYNIQMHTLYTFATFIQTPKYKGKQSLVD